MTVYLVVAGVVCAFFLVNAGLSFAHGYASVGSWLRLNAALLVVLGAAVIFEVLRSIGLR